MLAYDGLHYDALAVEAFRGAPEEVDITLFSTTDPLAGGCLYHINSLIIFQRKLRIVLHILRCHKGVRAVHLFESPV
jgi:hypothetical protein